MGAQPATARSDDWFRDLRRRRRLRRRWLRQRQQWSERRPPRQLVTTPHQHGRSQRSRYGEAVVADRSQRARTTSTQKGQPNAGRMWNYIKAWSTKKSNEAGSEIEIDRPSRTRSARTSSFAIRPRRSSPTAPRWPVSLEDAAGDVAEAKELAKQALLKADASMKAGNAATREVERRSTVAMKLQAAQNTEEMLRRQLTSPTSSPRRRRPSRPTRRAQQLAAKREPSGSSRRPRCRRRSTTPWPR